MVAFAPTQSSNIFTREEHTFEQHKQELLHRAAGQYVLIKEADIIGIFPTQIAAVEKGTELFITLPFYTRRIMEQEHPIIVPSPFGVSEK